MRRMNGIGINVRDSDIGKLQPSLQLTFLHYVKEIFDLLLHFFSVLLGQVYLVKLGAKYVAGLQR